MPVPASVDARVYVPAGAAGVSLANLAARLALESTGVTLPIAYPADAVAPECGDLSADCRRRFASRERSRDSTCTRKAAPTHRSRWPPAKANCA